MRVDFQSSVAKGEAKGEPMTAGVDKHGNYVLHHPSKRVGGKAFAKDYIRTQSAKRAKDLIEKHGHSMRMQIEGSLSGGASLVRAGRIKCVESKTPPRFE